ncbi:MAG TPA: cyanophycinase [Aliidongia sp.]|nr:cyanophycinase [Aliidongia sp.]
MSLLLLRALLGWIPWTRLAAFLAILLALSADGLHGPALAAPHGALLLVGGGDIPASIADRFVALAGGRSRHFVYIPTAAVDEEIDPAALERWFKTTFGVEHIVILHTRDRKIADSRAFAAPLDKADAVWFGGGRQWRIADAYLGTRTEAAVRRLLSRGGVVGGTSAGASILASYLVRGAPEGNWIISAPGHERGFGLLPHAAVDQHLDLYHRENDIEPLIRHHPALLGIGLDEATAIVVTGGSASVVGRGRVILHDGQSHCGLPYAVLRSGDSFVPGVPVSLPCRNLSHASAK